MCLTSLGFCNPSMLKSRVKMYIIFHFMSLSSKKTKNNKKNSNEQDQRGDFCRETRCVSKQNQINRPTHLVHHFSVSLLSSPSLSLKLRFLSLSHPHRWSLSHPHWWSIFVSYPFSLRWWCWGGRLATVVKTQIKTQ